MLYDVWFGLVFLIFDLHTFIVEMERFLLKINVWVGF